MSAVWPFRTNQGMAEAIQRNIELVGMPDWSADEDAFARDLQKQAGVAADGLRRDVTPLTGPTQQRAPSNDFGDVSWAAPMGRVSFPAHIQTVATPPWCAGAALATYLPPKR